MVGPALPDYEPLGSVPLDSFNLVYIIFYMQGIGQLFPWNAFITAGHYFTQRYCGTRHAQDFENYFSVTFMLCNLLSLALLVRHSARVERVPMWARVQAALALQVLLFAITAALVLFKDVDQAWLFAVTNLCVALCGLCTSVLQGATFGYAARFPPAYTQAMMAGQGLAGLIVAVAAIGAAFGSTEDVCSPSAQCGGSCTPYTSVDHGTFWYFAAAVLILLACMLTWAGLGALPFARYHASQARSPEELVGLAGEDGEGGTTAEPFRSTAKSSSREGPSAPASAPLSLCALTHHLGSPAVAVFVTFLVTLAIFPSLTEHIPSANKCQGKGAFYDRAFVPLQFLLFNLMDFAGRSLAGSLQVLPPSRLWFWSLVRLAFLPLFLLCNVERTVFPVVFASDAFPIGFMLLFALSNGYISSLSMMWGPRNAPPALAEQAGTVMIFLLTAGLSAGSGSSFLVTGISSGFKGGDC